VTIICQNAENTWVSTPMVNKKFFVVVVSIWKEKRPGCLFPFQILTIKKNLFQNATFNKCIETPWILDFQFWKKNTKFW
jgi:hypothetical protein